MKAGARFLGALGIVLALASARADEGALLPLKRLGRGVADRRTGAKLQLACVGKPKEGRAERGCELLQFLETDAGGRETLVGPVLDLAQSDRAKTVTRKIREELRCYGLFKHTSAGRFFLFSAAMMGDLGSEARRRCDDPVYSTLPEEEFEAKMQARRDRHEKTRRALAYSLSLGSWGGMAVLAATGVVGTAIAAPWGIEVYAASFVLDAAIYPFRLLFQSGGGPLGTRAKNVEALESRSKVAWQLRPKRMGHRKFARLLERLNALSGHGPKIEGPLTAKPAPETGVELISAVADEDGADDDAIAADSTPATRPGEWEAVDPETAFSAGSEE